MARDGNSPPIIKRKKIIQAGGHHGGAWKVAYADFVTAMMAFFLLMWLLNATTEKQRRGIADYFNPTISVSRISGGGDGTFGGKTVMSDLEVAYSGAATVADMTPSDDGGAEISAELAALAELNDALKAIGGESMTQERLMRHIVTRLTDEGLVIEIFDLPDSQLFDPETAVARPILRELTKVVAEVMATTRNAVAVNGHVMSYPIVLIENPIWQLSAERAQTVRRELEMGGLAPERIQRVAGLADRKLASLDPMASRNNRIEMILLRHQPTGRR